MVFPKFEFLLGLHPTEDRPVPNDLMVQIINSRLEEEDCVKHGWILFGFPLYNSISLLSSFINGGQIPNRILFLGKCIGGPTLDFFI